MIKGNPLLIFPSTFITYLIIGIVVCVVLENPTVNEEATRCDEFSSTGCFRS